MDIPALTVSQRNYYRSGATRPVDARKQALESLYNGIKHHEKAICKALHEDLRKSTPEAYMTEIGIVLEDIRYILKHLSKWMKPEKVKTPLAQFPSRSFRLAEPYGTVLIIAPWNYPVQLSLAPLVGALCAGNCAVVKPSAYTPNTSSAIADLIADCFPPEYVAVVEGGREQNTALLEQAWDYIFFTGSVEVGKLVMRKAADHLTPVTLELGGKSPCIVDETADLKVAAKRLAFGKVLNSGQTCVAPDYLLVHEKVKEQFLPLVAKEMSSFFPNGDYSNYPKIVNQKHFERIQGLMQSGKIFYGGETDPAQRIIFPTILDNVQPDEPVMQEEIFGPLLPVLTYLKLEDAIRFIVERPKPLALYLFTTNKKAMRRVLAEASFGGGCINDTIIHLATSYMPFGGVGASGMGSYHGKYSFETFSHYRSIVKKANWLDMPMRYHPYTKRNEKLIRLFMK